MKIFNKIMVSANHHKKSIIKKVILTFLLWQIAFLSLALILAILYLMGVLHLSASTMLAFLFLPLGLSVSAYLDIHEAGMEHAEGDPQ